MQDERKGVYFSSKEKAEEFMMKIRDEYEFLWCFMKELQMHIRDICCGNCGNKISVEKELDYNDVISFYCKTVVNSEKNN